MLSRSVAALVVLSCGFVVSCQQGNDPPETCSTNSAWLDGDEGSPLMHPGGDCIGCHSSEGEGPTFTVAGTVMGALDDDTDCNGIGGATVEILGTNGGTLTLVTNDAGNFFSTKALPTPYTARVTINGTVFEMGTAQTSGRCNACHTAAGENGAPGRIAAP